MWTLLAIVGAICWLIGWIWTLVIAFTNQDVLWGVLGIFCGIVAIVYAAQHIGELKVPLILMLIGVVTSTIGRVAIMAG